MSNIGIAVICRNLTTHARLYLTIEASPIASYHGGVLRVRVTHATVPVRMPDCDIPAPHRDELALASLNEDEVTRVIEARVVPMIGGFIAPDHWSRRHDVRVSWQAYAGQPGVWLPISSEIDVAAAMRAQRV